MPFRVFINSLIASPLPVLRDANADQLRIGQEHIGRQAAVVAVQEVAGDGRRVEDVLVIEHHLPAVLVGEDQCEVDVGVAANAIIRIVVEDARPGIILPIVIAAQRARPILRDRQRVLRAERNSERRRIGKFVATQILGETFAVVGRGRGIKADIAARDGKCTPTGRRNLCRQYPAGIGRIRIERGRIEMLVV